MDGPLLAAAQPVGGGVNDGAPRWAPQMAQAPLALQPSTAAPMAPSAAPSSPGGLLGGNGGDMLMGLLLAGPRGALAMAERNRKQATTQAQANQTARYLLAQGATPAEAAVIASNPKLMEDWFSNHLAGKQQKYQIIQGADGTITAINPANPRDNFVAGHVAAKPIAVPLGGSLVAPGAASQPNPTPSIGTRATAPQTAAPGYHTVYQNQNGVFDQPTLTAMADQYLAGDKSVLQNLGRGNMAAINITALRKRIVDRAKELGISPTETAARIGQFNSYTAAQQATGRRAGNVEMAAIEAGNLGNLVTETSAAVPRGNFPLWNKATNAFAENTGDPNIVKFTGALNSFINAYARAINPSGTSTVSDKDHAREILSTAMSHGQIEAGVNQLMAELEQVKKSPGAASKTLSDEFMTRANPTAPPTNTAPAEKPAATSAAQSIPDGATATNPSTGQKIIRRNGQWVPLQ